MIESSSSHTGWKMFLGIALVAIFVAICALIYQLNQPGAITETEAPPVTIVPPVVTTPPVVDPHADWSTFDSHSPVFELSYPGSGLVFDTAFSLPDAVGKKTRTLTLSALPTNDHSLDANGCVTQIQGHDQAPTHVTVGGTIFCLRVNNEGAAGSTYRTYNYTVDNADTVLNFAFTIRYATDVRVYAGCETDQSSEACKAYAFDEARDTALFTDILGTYSAK